MGSLALAPPPAPPVFPVYNLTRSPLTAALYYLNAWSRLSNLYTVELRYNEPALYNEVLGIANDFLFPSI